MDEASQFTATQAADPSTPAEVLHAIAASRADLRPYIAANPATYPALLEWLGGLGDPAVDGALRARAAAQPGAVEPEAPSAPPVEPESPSAPPAEPEAVVAEEAPFGGGEAAAGPSGQEAAGAYVPPAATSPGASGGYPGAGAPGEQPAAPYGAPQAGPGPYGPPQAGPAPYGPPQAGPAPYGPPQGEAPKKSRTWLWVLLSVVALLIVGAIVIAVITVNVLNRVADDVGSPSADRYGDSVELDALWDACEAGDMASCDDLFRDSPLGSEYEQFGQTCGERTSGEDWARCVDVAVDGVGGVAMSYGDSAHFDALWDECAAGNMASCDELYNDSPFGSEYEEFGDTCGGRTDGRTWCVENVA